MEEWTDVTESKTIQCLQQIQSCLQQIHSNLQQSVQKIETRLESLEQKIDKNDQEYSTNKSMYLEILKKLSKDTDEFKPILESFDKTIHAELIHPVRLQNSLWRASHSLLSQPSAKGIMALLMEQPESSS